MTHIIQIKVLWLTIALLAAAAAGSTATKYLLPATIIVQQPAEPVQTDVGAMISHDKAVTDQRMQKNATDRRKLYQR